MTKCRLHNKGCILLFNSNNGEFHLRGGSAHLPLVDRIMLVNFHSLICGNAISTKCFGSHHDHSAEIGGSQQKLKAMLCHFHSHGLLAMEVGPSEGQRLLGIHVIRIQPVWVSSLQKSKSAFRWLSWKALHVAGFLLFHGFSLPIRICQWNSP